MQIGRTRSEEQIGGLETALLRAHPGRARSTCALVVAVSGREEQRPASIEPAAAPAIARCLEAIESTARTSGGRVVRRRGAELVALFGTADAAAGAACAMQHEAARLLPAGGLGLRCALHAGPARQRGYDVFGEAIDVAAQLCSCAETGHIVISDQATSTLGVGLRYAVRVPPAKCGAPLGELDWRAIGKDCLAAFSMPGRPELRLTYRYNSLLRRRQADALTVGRDPDCDLCIDMRLASRRHCTIERRGDKFVLRDHSTNGTFVAFDGGREVRLRADEIELHDRGWLSFGVSRLLAEELVQFRCA